jgi:hypothetical protein
LRPTAYEEEEDADIRCDNAGDLEHKQYPDRSLSASDDVLRAMGANIRAVAFRERRIKTKKALPFWGIMFGTGYASALIASATAHEKPVAPAEMGPPRPS